MFCYMLQVNYIWFATFKPNFLQFGADGHSTLLSSGNEGRIIQKLIIVTDETLKHTAQQVLQAKKNSEAESLIIWK
jgi:hypothetical protein